LDDAVRDEASGFCIECSGEGRWVEEDRWVSHCYGQKEPAKAYALSTIFEDGGDVFSFLLPGNAETEWRVTEIPAVGGSAFAVSGGKTLDLVMIRSHERVECLRFETELDWLWVRFSDEQVQDVVTVPEKSSVPVEQLESLYTRLCAALME
jgi:hypothetical protein